ncbi:acetyl-CoA carboxylase [Natrarchaeobius sp. A-rgal3]|uniref:acetyl-CoA carboxylase n=1 Tax=Natrarchaeobius versutus TaxID=1679078 RepID=UPI00350ED9A6
MVTEYVTAPMPGVFYRRPDPEEPRFVEVGDDVSDGEVLGLVGAMKNFHELTAPGPGTVTDVLVDNESEIAAGQELIELTTDE